MRATHRIKGRRRDARALAIAVAFALLASCSDRTGGQATASFEPGPCPDADGLENARCGFLVVPENRRQATGKTIRLNVAILPARSTTPAPDPVVYMVGGPGGAALLSAPLLVSIGLDAERDVIIMDQRGTLFSDPALLCTVVDEFRAQAVGLVYDAPSTGTLHVEATRECRDALRAQGVDLAGFNTTESAADFAALRTVLGIDEWNVYGVSYGTDLAMTYMRAYPEGIRSVTIDSVVPPDTVLGDFWTNTGAGLGELFAQCEAQPACRERYPDTAATFARLVGELEASPIEGDVIPAFPGVPPAPDAQPVHVVVDGGALVNTMAGLSEALPTRVPALIDDLANGVTHDVLAIYAVTGVSHNGQFSYGLQNGVICSEWAPYGDRESIVAYGRAAFPSFPESVLAHAPQFPFMHDDCAVWDVPVGPASQREVGKEPIPVLVISGSYDALTSPPLARRVSDALTRSTFVLIPGVGHFVVPKSGCAADVLHSFLANPDTPDTSCVAGLAPPPFEIDPVGDGEAD